MKRFFISILLYLLPKILSAQTQYDYYEGSDAYGSSVDVAILFFKIIGVIVLAVLVILAIGSIWGLFAGWFKEDKDTPKKETSAPPKNNTPILGSNGLPKPNYIETITINGTSKEYYYEREDGMKFKHRFWCNIISIEYHGIDISSKIGRTHRIYSWDLPYAPYASKILENEYLAGSEKKNSMNYYLQIENGDFYPEKLHLREVFDTKLKDYYAIHYDKYIYSIDSPGLKNSEYPYYVNYL